MVQIIASVMSDLRAVRYLSMTLAPTLNADSEATVETGIVNMSRAMASQCEEQELNMVDWCEEQELIIVTLCVSRNPNQQIKQIKEAKKNRNRDLNKKSQTYRGVRIHELRVGRSYGGGLDWLREWRMEQSQSQVASIRASATGRREMVLIRASATGRRRFGLQRREEAMVLKEFDCDYSVKCEDMKWLRVEGGKKRREDCLSVFDTNKHETRISLFVSTRINTKHEFVKHEHGKPVSCSCRVRVVRFYRVIIIGLLSGGV
ncbi:hypothetical protein LXL04_008503 [Taraxacum kok-saghyz]